jgi:SAM-dependent methyltransferase
MTSDPAEAADDPQADGHAAYLREHYERLGDQSNDFRNNNLIELVGAMVEGPDVLDIGCGNGALLDRLSRRGAGRLVGVEPSEGLIALARRLHPHLEIVRGTGEAIADIDGRFDTVTMIDVLEHIEDDRGQLRLIHRRLKPGGQLIVLVPAHPVLFGPRDALQGHYRRYTRAELVGKLAETGFAVDAVRSWNAIAWLPMLVYGRWLGKTGGDGLRSSGGKSPLQRAGVRLLDAWYRRVENRLSFGFGLSLICTARPLAR